MAPYDESIPDLIRGTIRDGIALLRDEVMLVRTEVHEEYARIKSGLMTAVIAAVAGVLAAFMLLSTFAWGMAYAFEWPPWAGFAMVALPLLVIAVVLGTTSKRMLSRDRYLPKTTETLKENAEWIRARTQS
jgi:membrane protein implicated in regulation of membrane protease activity